MQVGLMRSKKNMGLENTAKRLNIDYVNRLDQEEYDV
jgi:molybdate-binding protein